MITLIQQERCNGDMMSTSVLKNSRVSNPAIFSKNFAFGSILPISKNYLTQFILHSQNKEWAAQMILLLMVRNSSYFVY
jgi:hypothetical protein